MIRLLLPVLLLFSTVLPGQNPWFKELKIDPQHDEQRITAIGQSSSGLLFIGTDQGLYNYDGFRFERLTLPLKQGKNSISCIAEADGDSLWIGLENGGLLQWSAGKFQVINSPAHTPVKSVLATSDSTLWMATYGEGIFYLKNNRWRRFTGIPDPFVYTMIQHTSGKLIAGTDLGMVVIDRPPNQISFSLYNAQTGLPDNIVTSLGMMKNGNVLVGFQEKGLYIFDPGKRSFKPVLSGEAPVSCMTRLRNEFWIGTDDGHIIDYEFSGDLRTRMIWPAESKAHGKISALFSDRDGNVWIASGQQLFFSPGEKMEFIAGSNGHRIDSIQALTAGRHCEIWYSNAKGLYRYDYLAKENERLIHYPLAGPKEQIHIVSLHMDKAGMLWIGTFDKGLFRLDPESGAVKHYGSPEGLPNANIIAVASRDSVIWLATLEGLVKCDARTQSLTDHQYQYTFTVPGGNSGKRPGFVYCIYPDSKGRIWYGTDGQGPVVYEHGHFKTFDGEFSLRMRIVYSITEDRNGNIWICTQGNGLFRYDGIRFRHFSLGQGLSDLDIKGITTDRYGNIVAVNTRAIDVINPVSLDVITMGSEAGLESISADINTISSDSRGGTWIGTREGLYRFNTDNVLFDRKPQLIIRGVYTFLKQDVSLRDSVFDYNQNHISIRYIGLWYADPERVSYRYRLRGYSNDWISTRDQLVTFPNLQPGSYVFEIMTGLNDQFRNAKVHTYSFVIDKPLWRENWFLFAVLALLGALIFLYIRERDLRLRRIEGLKKEKVEFQFATLRSQVNPHFLFNSFNTLIAVIEDDRGKAVEYVEHLSDYFRNMLMYRDKDTISLRQELEMVDTYYYLQKKRFGDHLQLNLAVPPDWPDQFVLPPLSLQLLIENAVKHNAVSHESPLTIKVEASGQAELRITNNLNPKKHPEPSTGIGLENLASRFKILAEKDVRILHGTNYYSIVIPLIKTK